MKLTGKEVNRMGIFFMYDSQGVVDDYITYMLACMKKYCSFIMVVCNGCLTVTSRKKLENIENVSVLVRENIGFDVWAYKAALKCIGGEKLSQYDEVIMFNHTIMGPIVEQDLAYMFQTMDQKDLDFWGISIHHGADTNLWGIMPEGYVPVHLQSHFIAVRNKMLTSYEFKQYWDQIPEISCYEEAVAYHEVVFTKYFSEKGYTWEAYCETKDYFMKTFCPIMSYPVEMLQIFRCPFVKRKIFFNAVENNIQESCNQIGRTLIKYISQNTTYNLRYIYQNILRIESQKNYVPDMSANIIYDSHKSSKSKIVIVVSESYELSDREIAMLQKQEQVYVVGSKNAGIVANSKHFKDDERNFASIYYEVAKIQSDAEYVLILSNNTQVCVPSENDNGTYRYVISESMMGIDGNPQNVLANMQENEFCGAIYAPVPFHSKFYSWTVTSTNSITQGAKKVLEESGVEFEEKIVEDALSQPGGSMWIRLDLLREFTSIIPEQIWGNVSNYQTGVFSKVMSIVLQKLGWYCSVGYSESLVYDFLNSGNYINEQLKRISCKDDWTLVQHLQYLSEKISGNYCYVYYNRGKGYLPFMNQRVMADEQDGKISIIMTVPQNTQEIKIEFPWRNKTVLQNVHVDQSGIQLAIQSEAQYDGFYVFDKCSPVMFLKGDFLHCKEICVTLECVETYEKAKYVNYLSQKLYEHSCAEYALNEQMKEFQSAIKKIEVERDDYKYTLLNVEMAMEQKDKEMGLLKSRIVQLESFHFKVTNSKIFKILRFFDRK